MISVSKAVTPNYKMSNVKMKTPISYYGDKQKLATKICSLIPEHTLYCEPFIGGGAIFFAKVPLQVEVLNDTNKELINFYRVVKDDFVSLEKEIRITLHSRNLHRKASVIYNFPDMFSEIKRAWAGWLLSCQSFCSKLDVGGRWRGRRPRCGTGRRVRATPRGGRRRGTSPAPPARPTCGRTARR